jgi:hypothetical protein
LTIREHPNPPRSPPPGKKRRVHREDDRVS